MKPKYFVEEYLYVCKFFLKSGLVFDEGIPGNMCELIDNFVGNMLTARNPSIDSEFVKSYQESLYNLCSTDPILAFKLRGMESFNQLIKAKDRYIADLSVSLEVGAPSQVKAFVDREVKSEGGSAIAELIKDIESDFSKVSFSCSVFTWIHCQRIFKNKPKSTIKSNTADIEGALGRIFKILLRR